METKKKHIIILEVEKVYGLKEKPLGMYHHIKKMLIDDDQDCVIFEVKLTKPKKGGKAASCHVGYKSCFYRKIELKRKSFLKFTEKKKLFDPEYIYKGIPNPTKI